MRIDIERNGATIEVTTVDPQSFYVSPLSALEVAEGFIAVAAEFESAVATSTLSVRTNISQIVLQANGKPSTLRAQIDNVVPPDYQGATLLRCTNGELHLQQNPQQEFGAFTYTPDQGLGAVRITSAVSPEAARSLLVALSKHFKITAYDDLVRGERGAGETAALQLRERAVATLERRATELSEFLESLAKRDADFRREALAEVQKHHEEQSAKLEDETRAKRNDLDKIYSDKDEELGRRTRAFDEERKKFDERMSTVVRRDLLTRIESVLKEGETSSVSTGTEGKREMVHTTCRILLGASAVILAIFLYRIFGGAALEWKLLGPMTAASVTFVSTMIYYIKWNDRWFREHAESEFAAKRYKADMLRASWIAELFLEHEPTEALVEAFTRGLFTVTAGRESEHPFDHLTGLLKRANEVKISRGSFTLKAPKGDRPVPTEE